MPSSTTSSSPTHTAHGAHHSSTSTSSPASSTSRPLLFFVALGFGVVFTNLWIIVGVKYCFRYNRRARARGIIDQETGEPIDLANMQRPRRRREKKLMTMDEVNERFPLTKYKIWRAAREEEGLPTTGGVTAPPSRAVSIKEAMMAERTSMDLENGTSVELGRASNPSDNMQPPDMTETKDFADSTPSAIPVQEPEGKTTPVQTLGPSAQSELHQQMTDNVDDDEEDEDDDPIRTAVPAELLQQPGDACAICIDTIEDEDEVRGLTCGHAFHAGCLDPWLTNRRACCPLCKADYFIPKPRPEGEAANGIEHPALPSNVWLGGRAGVGFRPRLLFTNSRFTVDHHDRFGFPVLVRENRVQRRPFQTRSAVQPNVEDQPQNGASSDQVPPQQSTRPSFRSRLRGVQAGFRPSRTRAEEPDSTPASQDPPAEEAQASPGQVEAATR